MALFNSGLRENIMVEVTFIPQPHHIHRYTCCQMNGVEISPTLPGVVAGAKVFVTVTFFDTDKVAHV